MRDFFYHLYQSMKTSYCWLLLLLLLAIDRFQLNCVDDLGGCTDCGCGDVIGVLVSSDDEVCLAGCPNPSSAYRLCWCWW